MSDEKPRQAEEKYKLLVSLWSAENQVKTAKLQMFGLVTSILASVSVSVPQAWTYVCLVGAAFSAVWLFSIGRTLYYQAYWRDQIDRIHEQFSDNPMLDIFDANRLKQFKPEGIGGIAGRISSRGILLGAPFVGVIGWLAAWLGLTICN